MRLTMKLTRMSVPRMVAVKVRRESVKFDSDVANALSGPIRPSEKRKAEVMIWTAGTIV